MRGPYCNRSKDFSNGPAESINSRGKTIKVRGRGFRNNQQFANALYFNISENLIHIPMASRRAFHMER
ncbi:MAG: transposase [Bacteroidetes bacterium]|nr:transposase [Bacteroidota bacterium]